MNERPPLLGAEDTIAAIATPQGRSALAVIRVSGKDARSVVESIASGRTLSDRRAVLLELRDPASRELLDTGIVTLYEGPRSYTGEDLVELSVHGGALGPSLVLHALLSAGAREALPGEFTRRAVIAGKLDVLQAEGIADLIDARSRTMRRVAVQQADGALSRRIESLRQATLSLEALIAYDIDFPEEDEGHIAPERIDQAARELVAGLDGLLATAHMGELVREGAVVVIAGAPNAGKSSLFNAVIGSNRAIVTDIAGTTRDAIEAVVEIGGWPVRLVDTAGLRESEDVVERIGIEVSERYLAQADLVLVVGDTRAELGAALEYVRRLTSAVVLAVWTKSDLVAKGYEDHDLVAPDYECLRLSALTGEGLDRLADAIAAELSRLSGVMRLETPLLTRERHHRAVSRARDEVRAFGEAWGEHQIPAPVAAVHLRAAEHALEELIGIVDVEDVLDLVFASFCVGK